jgi:predicted PurR-regulated permease PerM
VSNPAHLDGDNKVLKLVVESAVRLLVLAVLFYFCLQIASPFVGVILWAVIIAVAVYPIFLKLLPMAGGRRGTVATGLVILTLTFLIVPVVSITGSIIDSIEGVSAQVEAGTFKIPPPGDRVKDWPVIGEKVHTMWSLASENLSEAANQYRGQIKKAMQSTLGMVGGFSSSLFVFIFSTIFAGMFLASGESGYAFTIKLMDRLAADRGKELADLSVKTVRSVAQGVIGIAVIQAVLAALGMIVIGVPAAALWSLLVLVFAIAQIPVLLVFGPIIVWVFSAYDTMPATIFMVYGIVVSVGDGFLKPLLLGRGMDIPMPVILVGAIGGMIYAGIIGLFIGAIILALGYSLFIGWLENAESEVNTDE